MDDPKAVHVVLPITEINQEALGFGLAGGFFSLAMSYMYA